MNVLTGRPAKTNDPSTWTDFTTASDLALQRGYEGVGFVFQPPYVGVDIDHCIKDGAIAPYAVEILKAAGLSVVLQFMSGYPEETPEDIAVTCRALAELHPDAIRIYPFTPLDDTKIAERLQRGETRFDPETAIDRAADLFLAAQEAGIPTIRIGLPKENLAGSPYPDNLAQVVMAEALVKVAARGEREFHIPVSWRTSLAIARRSGHFPADATVVFVS